MRGCFLVTEYTGGAALHSATAYLVVSLVAPLAFVAWRVPRNIVGETPLLSPFTRLLSRPNSILPLFTAQPKLGSLSKCDSLRPMAFPLLLIVPGLALDLFWRAVKASEPWLQAALTGIVFLAGFVTFQSPFANFLMSPLSRNRISERITSRTTILLDFCSIPIIFKLRDTRVQFWIVMTICFDSCVAHQHAWGSSGQI